MGRLRKQMKSRGLWGLSTTLSNGTVDEGEAGGRVIVLEVATLEPRRLGWGPVNHQAPGVEISGLMRPVQCPLPGMASPGFLSWPWRTFRAPF